MVYPFITVAVDIEDGAKGAGIVVLFGALVNQAAEFPGNRRAIKIGFHEVLLQLPPNRFEQVTEMTNNGIDLEQRVFVLDQVTHTQRDQRPYNQPGPVNARPDNTGDNQHGAEHQIRKYKRLTEDHGENPVSSADGSLLVSTKDTVGRWMLQGATRSVLLYWFAQG